MPRRNYPDEFSQLIFSIFDDKGHNLPSREPDDPILLRIIGPLVFEIREAEEIAEGSKVNSASF
jgi:hypothetical protein